MSMRDSKNRPVRMILPSKGELSDPTLDFLSRAGLKVVRPNPRQYDASIPALSNVSVLFQRASDIYDKVSEGTGDFGITGYDVVAERGMGETNVVLMHENLGFGECELVLAVPDNWIDVTNFEDLAELALLYKERGDDFRIATKYPNLTRNWLHDRGIYHFSMVQADGALEAAPNMGYAEMIVDVTTTGTTLRENRLKRIAQGTVLQSQACLVGNRRLLKENREALEIAKIILELIEAHVRAKKFLSVTMNVQAESEEAIHRLLAKEKQLAGLRGPSIARVYAKNWGETNWFAANIVIERNLLPQAINYFREIGGQNLIVTSLDYLFEPTSSHYESLLEKLKRG